MYLQQGGSWGTSGGSGYRGPSPRLQPITRRRKTPITPSRRVVQISTGSGIAVPLYLGGSRHMRDSQLGILPVAVPLILKGVTAAAQIVGLTKKAPTIQKQTYKAFAAAQSLPQGREMSLVTLRDAFYYQFKMTSHGLYKVRKAYGTMSNFLKALAQKIADAAISGAISNTDDAAAVFIKVIGPWWNSLSGDNATPSTTNGKMVIAFIDKYLYDQPLTLPEYKDYVAIPKLSEVLAARMASAPVSAPPPTAPQIMIPLPQVSTVPLVAASTPVEIMASPPQIISVPGMPSPATSDAVESGQVAPPTQASMFSGAPGWLIPTAIGAILFLATRKRR